MHGLPYLEHFELGKHPRGIQNMKNEAILPIPRLIPTVIIQEAREMVSVSSPGSGMAWLLSGLKTSLRST